MDVGRNDIGNETADLLLGYASGTLDEALSVLTATLLTLSPQARQHVQRYEALGGALIENCCEPVRMSEQSLQSVLDRLDEPEEARGGYILENAGFPESLPLPRPICRLLNHDARKPLAWKPAFRGMHVYELPVRGSRMHLVRMAPGARVPVHAHRGEEFTLVLEGSYSDRNGCYRRGDLVIYDHTSGDHTPVADETVGCLCLAVLTEPLRFRGMVGSLLNFVLR